MRTIISFANLLRIDPRFFDVNGVRLAVWEHPGADPPILFIHATGFHARCWDQVAARIPNRRKIAIDMRGHGQSSKPEPPYEWHNFGEDVAAVCRELNVRGAAGVGHSMGGHSLVLAATLVPTAFAGLLLIDPVMFAESKYGPAPWHQHFARKRKNQWSSPREMIERFKTRPPFLYWDAAVLRDYCDYGLLPAPDGDGYVLACPPHIEGSIYEASGLSDANLYGKFEQIDVPVTILRSTFSTPTDPGMEMAVSPTAPDLASHFRHARDIETSHSHFIPMEAPALIADLVGQSL